jgi:hypothetical protein
MKVRFRTASLPLLALLALSAAMRLVDGAEILEEIIERDYPIDTAAKFSLKNADGTVLIYGADINEMKIQAIKKAYTKDRLSKINVDISVKHDAVTITTAYPPKPKWGLRDRSGTVDYVIILPWFCDLEHVELGNGEMLIEGMRGNEVHAQLGSGRLFGHNCFTDLHLSLGNGGMDVGYDWWETHSIALDATIADGNTRLFIPSDAQFQLHAETPNGHIFSDFTNKENRHPGGQTKLELSVGSAPNAQMKIQASDGSLKIMETNQ